MISSGERMWKLRLTIALLVGSVFGGLSFLLERPDFGVLVPFLIPGCVVAIIFSGNVHAFSIRAVAVGNFLFYSGLLSSLIALSEKYRLWEKYKEKYKTKVK
jgi:hypothetical protein